MTTLLMVIATALIVCGLLVAVICMEDALADNASDG